MANAGWSETTRWRLAAWGHELYEQGAYERAGTVFAALLEESRADPYVVQALAACHLAVGNPAACVDLMRWWLSAHPANPAASLRLAEGLAALGHTREAAAELAAVPASVAGPARARLQFRLGL
ncbi:MAG: hypothetical protein IPP47_27860 [Bryobacterales bacterium]|nr:hypothetical protein [Bryobacterales bacterium]